MVLEIKLINRFFRHDLEIFQTFRLANGKPLRAIGTYKKAETDRINHRYQKLMRGRNLSEKRLQELERIVNQSWNQYVDLYSGKIESFFYKRYFQCTVYELMPEEEHGAMYVRLSKQAYTVLK